MPMTSPTAFAARLAALLEQQGLRPATLSRQIGRSPTYIRDLLQGRARIPRADALPALAQALGTTVEDLLGEPPATPPAGLAEPGVMPFDHSGSGAFATAVATLVKAAPGRAAWTCGRGLPGFRIAPGDVLVVRLGGNAAAGDLVLATTTDHATGEATTSLRQLLPPYLLPDDPLTGRALLLDHDRHAILGRVLHILRDLDAPSP